MCRRQICLSRRPVYDQRTENREKTDCETMVSIEMKMWDSDGYLVGLMAEGEEWHGDLIHFSRRYERV
jgi:hypothetical protein